MDVKKIALVVVLVILIVAVLAAGVMFWRMSQVAQANPGYGPGMMGRGGMMGGNYAAQGTRVAPSGASSSSAISSATNSAASSSASASAQSSAASSAAPAAGPGRGRGMMGGGQPAGGLTAVVNNQNVPNPAGSNLPENTAAQKIGNMNVTIALTPYPPVSFQAGNFVVTLTDDKGQAITDAKMSIDLTMPGMWMPPSKPEAKHVGNGNYQASATWTMRGQWRMEVIIERGGIKQSAFFDVWL